MVGCACCRRVTTLTSNFRRKCGVDGLIGLLPQGYDAYYQLQDQLLPGNVDQTVLSFAFLMSLLTGVFFGIVPAWQASNPVVNDELKEGGRGAEAAPRQRLRG